MATPGASVFFDANGIRHHYLHWGDTNNPCIILLHGIRSYAKTWLNTAERLKDRFYVIALDLRGRGKSGWSADKKYYYQDYVADLEALVNQLNIGSCYLLGHSLGGQNALLYAAKHPSRVNGLIVEDIGPGSSASGEGAARIVREFNNTPAIFDSWEEATAFWRSIRPGISEESLGQRVRETLKEAKGRVIWSYDFVGIKDARLAAAIDTSMLPDLWSAVEKLACPTLVMRGAISDFLSRETLAAMVERNPLIESAEISGATHYVHDDNFEEFFSAVNGFLNRCLKKELHRHEST